jgi:molybdopterin molybdotransferase
MTPYAQALARVRAVGARRAQGEEDVPLEQALGRVCARAAVSPEAMPGFDNSGMDGFAVRAADTASAALERPLTLPVRGQLAAGDDAAHVRPGGGAVEIMTGAPLPPGCDAVVRVEDVEVVRGGADEARGACGEVREVVLRAPVRAGDHVRPRGEDFSEGFVLLEAGERVRPEHVMALATVGLAHVRVRRRPRVALVATGKELVPHPTRQLAPGQVRNSNLPYLAAGLALLGAECVSAEAVGDAPEDFRQALARTRERGVDLVLTTGAVSMGRHDYVAQELAALGASVHFHKVAMRPGKPLLFAELPAGPAVFGLPGNPVSTAVGLRFFVTPFLRAVLGLPPELPLRALLRREANKPEGLRCFFRGALELAPGGLSVEVLRGQGSAMVSTLVAANAWVTLPEAGALLAEGSEVEVWPMHAGGTGWPQAVGARARPGHAEGMTR